MRKAINTYREQKTYKRLDAFCETNLVAEEQIQVSSLNNLILKEVNQLSNEQQIVLRLFYVEGYKVYQIADDLNIAKGTVKSRLFTAREKLKLILKTNTYER